MKLNAFIIFIFASYSAHCQGSTLQMSWAQAIEENNISAAEKFSLGFLDDAQNLSNLDSLGLAWYRIAWVEKMKGNYSGRLFAYIQSKKFYQESGDLAMVTQVSQNIGIVYREMGQPNMALQELLYADSISAILGKPRFKIKEYLAWAYSDIDEIKEAQHHLNEALSLSLTTRHSIYLSTLQAKLFIRNKDFTSARKVLTEALDQVWDPYEFKGEISWIHYFLGLCDFKTGAESASAHLTESVIWAEGKMADPYLLSGYIDESKGRLSSALETYHLLFHEFDFLLEEKENRESFLEALDRAEAISHELNRAQDFPLYTDLRKMVINQGMIGIDEAKIKTEWAEFQKDEIARLTNDLVSSEKDKNAYLLGGIFVILFVFGWMLYRMIVKRRRTIQDLQNIADTRRLY